MTSTIPIAATTASIVPKRIRVVRSTRLSTVLFWSSTIWLVGVAILALTAPWLPIADPDVGVGQPRTPPFQEWSEPLGTDGQGRSMLSRMIWGARASLSIGVLSVVIGLFIGGALGLAAGYLRGKFDAVIGILTDTMLAFPGLVLLLAIGSIVGPGATTLILGLGLIAVPVFIRITRANTLRFADREFVQAARLVGARDRRIVMREIVPNVVPSLVAYAVIVMATLITAEAAISFLGLGLRPPAASWGGAIAAGQFELSTTPYLVFVPAAILAFTVFAFNILGDRIRAKLDIGQSKI